MTMISAKEFSGWLLERFADETQGVSLSREDINTLTGRRNFSLGYIHDIHYEVMRYGMAFVTDTTREMFYLIPISERPWRKQLEKHYEYDLYCNVLPLNKSG